jgi:transposase
VLPAAATPPEEALQGYVLTDGKLNAADTPVPVLLTGNKKTKTVLLWTHVLEDRYAGSALASVVWFAYRKGSAPRPHLDAAGQCRCPGFNKLYRNSLITDAANWANASGKTMMCTFIPRQY